MGHMQSQVTMCGFNHLLLCMFSLEAQFILYFVMSNILY